MLHQAFGAYFAALVDERGWSKTALSGAAAMQPMESALLGPVLGWIVDRFGPQGMIRIGVVLFGLGFILLSQIDTLAGFYGAFVVIALGSSLCGFFPINVAIIHWFQIYRARALSSVGLGLALGGVFVPVIAWAIQTHGWRPTAFASGVLAIVIGWPLSRVFRRSPAEIGETVDGLPVAPPPGGSGGAGARAAASDDQPEFTARQALRTQAFWFISLGHGFALLVVYAVNVHAITHMKEGLGYSLAEASIVITLMTVAQIGGPMIAGLLADVTGSYLAGFTLLAVMVGAGSLFFLLARKPRLAAAG